MIDEPTCYVRSADPGPPQYLPEKMDICYENALEEVLGDKVGGGGGRGRWQDEWEDEEDEDDDGEEDRGDDDAVGSEKREKNVLHNRDKRSIVRKPGGEIGRAGGGMRRNGSESSSTTYFSGVSVTEGRSFVKRPMKCPHPSKIVEKYGQRPRTIIRRLVFERRLREHRSPHKTVKAKLQTMSKCPNGRRSVSAREWCHMQEINLAFESLRNALPCHAGGSDATCSDTSAAAKMTTLRLALRYIEALTQLLQDDDQGPPTTDDESQGPCNCSASSEGGGCLGSNDCEATDDTPGPSRCDRGDPERVQNEVDSHHEGHLNNNNNDHVYHAQHNPGSHNYYSAHPPPHRHPTTAIRHHDRHKRPRYHSQRDDSHDAQDSGDGGSSPSNREGRRGGEMEKIEVVETEEGVEEDDPEIYIEAIAGIFQEPSSSSFDPSGSWANEKGIHASQQKNVDEGHLGRSVALPKAHPSLRVIEGQKVDPCSSGDFGDLAENHLEVLEDLQRLSEVESDALLLESEESALTKGC